MTTSGHTPVLLEETLAALSPKRGETALDCTVGLGGHAVEIAARIGPEGTLIICDHDPANLARSQERIGGLPAPPNMVAWRGSFAEAPARARSAGLRIDVLLADLGFASTQVDDPARGFSFSREGPLDMRLDPDGPTTAADLVNTVSEQELASILWEYGEERRSRRIARKLVESRRVAPITTTGRLAELVRSVTGPKRRSDRIDPATRTFQALRIAVNDELGALDLLLESIEREAGAAPSAERWLAPSARLGFISFHSLEDRRVKHALRRMAQRGDGRLLTKKPIVASEVEQERNPRARSARLRAIELRSGSETG